MKTINDLSDTVVECLVDHFGQSDRDDLDDMDIESTQQTVNEIESRWAECSHDLSHLSRADRDRVLQRGLVYRGEVIDGCEVRLIDNVQVAKGRPRQTGAIVDLGDSRLVILF